MNAWDRASFEWPLRHGAMIVELGVYEGRWLAGMIGRYAELRPRILGFEPQAWAYERAAGTLVPLAEAAGLEVELRPWGVTVQDEPETLELRAYHTDAASVLIDDEYYRAHPGEGRRDVASALFRPVADELGDLEAIDLMMINIEGYEYPLLWRMLDLGIIERVRHLAVQWHRSHDPSGDTERRIRARLAETHDVRFDFGAMLVGWSSRESAAL